MDALSSHFAGRRGKRIDPVLVAIAGAAAIARLAYVRAERDRPISADGFSYSIVGDLVAEGEGFRNPLVDAPTALHPPGWSLVLAAASSVGLDTVPSHQVVAALIGTVTVVLVGLLGARLGGRPAGWVAAFLAAAHPNLWLWERELAAEVLLLPLVAATLLLAHRHMERPAAWTAVALGLASALAALTRTEQAALLILFVTPAILRPDPDTTWVLRLGWLAAAAGTAVLVVAPWIAYNHGRFEEPVLLTTGAGVTMRYAYNPTTFHGDRLGYGDPSTWTEMLPGDESQSDAAYRRAAWEYVTTDEDRLPAVIAARQGRTWGLFRPVQQARFDQDWGNSAIGVYLAGLVAHLVLVVPAMAGGIVLRRRRTRIWPLLSVVGVVVAYTALTYGQPRYRVTADVVIVVLAGVGIDAVWRWWRARQRRGSPGEAGAGAGPLDREPG